MNSETHPLQTTARRRSPIGWPEIIVGLIAFYALGHTTAFAFDQFDAGTTATGVVMAQIAGIAGLGGFALAFAVRIRRLEPFGFTRTTTKWLLLGALSGAVLFLVRGFVTLPLVELFDLDTMPSDLPGGAQGGLLALLMTGIGISIIGPIGEELLFRGVIQSGLLRYGAVISTLGSAGIFALAHGINIVMPVALLFGVLAAELYRRSGSIWPAIIAHVVHNAPTVFLYTQL
jgi:membrane protease YdiL (CAAX protease family)